MYSGVLETCKLALLSWNQALRKNNPSHTFAKCTLLRTARGSTLLSLTTPRQRLPPPIPAAAAAAPASPLPPPSLPLLARRAQRRPRRAAAAAAAAAATSRCRSGDRAGRRMVQPRGDAAGAAAAARPVRQSPPTRCVAATTRSGPRCELTPHGRCGCGRCDRKRRRLIERAEPWRPRRPCRRRPSSGGRRSVARSRWSRRSRRGRASARWHKRRSLRRCRRLLAAAAVCPIAAARGRRWPRGYVAPPRAAGSWRRSDVLAAEPPAPSRLAAQRFFFFLATSRFV